MKITKKILISITTFTLMISIFAIGAPKLASLVYEMDYKFVINGEKVEIPRNLYILSKNNSTYVPIRFVSENLGATVKFENGKISITDARYMRDLENGKMVPIETYRKQLDDANAEIAKLKKENESLKSQMASLEKNYANVSAYKKLPAGEKDIQGLEIRIDSIKEKNNHAMLNIVITNHDRDVLFNFLPERTELVYNSSASSKPIKYTTVLSSTLMPYTSPTGLSSMNGELEFDFPYVSNANGTATFYYRVNQSSDIKSMTVHFTTK